jgi:hypothetical protein
VAAIPSGARPLLDSSRSRQGPLPDGSPLKKAPPVPPVALGSPCDQLQRSRRRPPTANSGGDSWRTTPAASAVRWRLHNEDANPFMGSGRVHLLQFSSRVSTNFGQIRLGSLQLGSLLQSKSNHLCVDGSNFVLHTLLFVRLLYGLFKEWGIFV